ncbi:hypothetical protein TNCT_150261, partial [Trichonephila clavata]
RRERSTESFHGSGNGRVSAERTRSDQRQPLRLDGRTLGGTVPLASRRKVGGSRALYRILPRHGNGRVSAERTSPTHRLDLTEGPWVTFPLASRRKVGGRECSTESFHGSATAVCRRNERSANPPLRLDGRTLGGPSRLLHDARSVGRERSTESFHGSATAVCRRNERSANPPLRLDGRTLGGPSRLLHDARSVGRERSTESFHARQRPCVAERTSANPPLRLDGRTLGGPSRLLHDARSVGRERSTESFHGTATAVCRGTNGPPTHRLDLTEGPWVDRPACFTTQGRWVESALPNPSTHGNGRVSRNERSANPPLRLDGRTLGGPSRLLHDARSVGRERSTESFHARQRPCVAERTVRQPTA